MRLLFELSVNNYLKKMFDNESEHFIRTINGCLEVTLLLNFLIRLTLNRIKKKSN